MASTDAKPVPIKNQAYRVYFSILDADGDPVASATIDSGLSGGTNKAIVSKDGAAVVNSNNNVTGISNGLYYLDLDSAEMNFDNVSIMVRTTTADAKNTPIHLYPEEAGDIRVNVTQVSGDTAAADNLESEFDGTGYKSYLRRNTAQAGAAGTITLDASASATDDLYNGLLVAIISGTGAGQARLISDYVGSTKVATVTPNWTTNPDATSVFLLLSTGRVDLALWLGSAPNALATGRVDADATAISGDSVAADNLELVIEQTRAVLAKIPFQKNTAYSNYMFLMVDDTDGKTPETGLTPTCQRSIDGAAFAACANSPTEVASGWYKINLAATDLDGDEIVLRITDATSRNWEHKIRTIPTS